RSGFMSEERRAGGKGTIPAQLEDWRADSCPKKKGRPNRGGLAWSEGGRAAWARTCGRGSVRDVERRAAAADVGVHLVPLLLRVAAGIVLQCLLVFEFHHDRVGAVALGLQRLGPDAFDALERLRHLVCAVEGGLDLLRRGALLPRDGHDVDDAIRGR